MTQPLLLRYPEDSLARSVKNQFLLGNILVAPVF